MLEQPHFGRRLKRLRLERGMSQAGLVGEGLSTGYLSRLESGERRPTERAVTYLAQRLGVDASMLTGPSDGRSLTGVLAAVASAPPGTDETAALSRAVEEDAGDDPAARWQALWLLSRAAGRDGDYERERERLLEIIELSDLLEAAELRVRSHVQYARCTRALGDMRTAEPAAVEALSIARAERLPVPDTMAALMVVISIETELGRLEAAGRHVDELERELLPEASPSQAAEALWTAAMVSNRQGDHAAAQTRLETALGLPRSGDDLLLWSRLRAAATAAALQMSPPRVAAAERWLGEAASVLALIGTPLQVQEVRALQAHLAFHQGRLDDARALSRALLCGEELRLSYRDRVRLSVLDGRLMILAGRVDEGIAALQELGRQAAESRNLDLATHVWQTLATTLAEVRPPQTPTPSPTGPPEQTHSRTALHRSRPARA
ncbi:helix-turn-helix domain-containing protein [Streptomyces beigongshangae]|uniref:helix-turn-helix domain-containing protein n=1 Tax=Streptomyces beigongshangae TaxID=2841597 RepID=UPI001C846E20|nr:helix-turn-helix domain-containing protein [Streptomyces sp. REN17]